MMEGDIHATQIVNGYTKASKLVIEKMKSWKVNILECEIPKEEEKLLEIKVEPKRKMLMDVCMSVLNTRLEREVAKDVAEVCVTAMCQMFYGLTVKELRDKRININDIHVHSYKDIDEGASFVHGIIINQGVCNF